MRSPPATTIGQALSQVCAAGIERRDAQRLVLLVTGREGHERAWLVAHDDQPLSEGQLAHLDQTVRRYQQSEPMAYITGQTEFFGLMLTVDSRVLIARPDTETLVQWALNILQARPVDAPPPAILDMGTGSGAIALAIRHECTAAQVLATDASEPALTVARGNAERLGLEVLFAQGSWWAAVPRALRLDVIVSNPPYVREGDPHLAALQHEPQTALTSGPDGLDDIRHLVTHAPGHLLPGGWLLVEHGYDQADTVAQLLRERGFAQVQSRQDLGGNWRCTGGQWQSAG